MVDYGGCNGLGFRTTWIAADVQHDSGLEVGGLLQEPHPHCFGPALLIVVLDQIGDQRFVVLMSGSYVPA